MTGKGKPLRVVITGASSGIGEALAREYARRGASLGLIARRKDALAQLIQDLPGEHAYHVADVTCPESLREAACCFEKVFGLADLVIACAGVSVGTLTEEPDDFSAFERVMQTNLLGMVATFQPFVGKMRNRGSGHLVGISSVAGVRGLPGAAAYSASKAAVGRYLESLRVELRGTGVAVSDIRPGYIRTPMTAVNAYRMPFLMDVDEAARRFIVVIDKRASQATIPWQMGMVAKVLPWVPNMLYDYLASRAGRKPRGLL